MEYKVGDRIIFEGYTGTIIDIVGGDLSYKIDWDKEMFGPSIVSGRQIKAEKPICEEHGTRRLYSKSRDDYICPFCQ